MLLIPKIHQAYWEAEQEAEEKARTKLQERVIKRWTRLVHGLRIRQRLQEQYGDKPQTEEQHWLDTQAHGTDPDGEEGVSASRDSYAVHIEDLFSAQDGPQAGGYLTAADDVVQAFHLPKYQHVVAAYSANSSAYHINPDKDGSTSQIGIENKAKPVVAPINLDIIHGDQEDDIEMEGPTVIQSRADRGVPMTMRELADAVGARSIIGDDKPSTNAKDSYPSQNNGIRSTPRNKTIPDSGAARSVRSISPFSTASKPRASAGKRARGQKASMDPTQTLLGKRGRMDGASATSTSAPTRVLRPRAPKSAARIQEERKMEQAYKRAVAE
jgi:xeroderma pigmentosum group C-complementing protein